MIHAYDASYLVHSEKVLGWMLDAAVNLFAVEATKFWRVFLSSGYAERFGSGESRLLSGMTGYELAVEVLDAGKVRHRPSPPREVNGLSPEYWAGWALARYQWYTALSFAAIDEVVPIGSVITMYDPFHEMDIRHFFGEMNKLILEARPDTNLKRLRVAAGFSQDDLARLSGVPVRMIQYYEQRVRSVNRAAYETVAQLAQALRCRPEALAEGVLPDDDWSDVPQSA